MNTKLRNQLKRKRSFVFKLFKLRRSLILKGNSYINNARAFSLMESMRIWMEAYPNVTEEQFNKFLKRNYESLKYLIPGGECKSKNSWIDKLNEFVNI